MITVLCANAGLDKTYEVEGFGAGGYYHPKRMRTAPGGKGINVARVLRALGHDVVVTGWAGGSVAQYITNYLRRENITADFVGVAEESRLCINIIDTTRKTQTRLDELGPLVTPSEIQALHRKWHNLLERSEMAILSGNAPRGVPFDLYGELILAARARHVTTVLDAHDELLRDAVPAAPSVVKPNLAELSSLFDKRLSVPAGVVEAGEQLIHGGVRVVLCSLGSQGALVVARGGRVLRARAPQVTVVNHVGAGDAMVAGFVSASVERRPLEERVQWAVAAGSASTTVFGAGFVTRPEVEALVPQVAVSGIEEEPAPEPAQEAQPPGALAEATKGEPPAPGA